MLGRHAEGRVAWRLLAGAGAAVALGHAGLRVHPRSFPPYPVPPDVPGTLPLPDGLPAPVDRFYRLTYGDRVPVVTSAVLSGRATLRPVPGGPTFQGRFRFVHEAGRNYRHYIEATWFGRAILKVNESYVDGVSRQRMPWPLLSSDGHPKGAQAANLGLWSETSSFPSVFLTDPRVTWTAVDATTALLTVPFEDDRETYVVRFDSESGRPRLFESMRYRATSDARKRLWLNETLAWQDFGGVVLPKTGAAMWLDQGRPWATFTTEELVLNADVREAVRRTGP